MKMRSLKSAFRRVAGMMALMPVLAFDGCGGQAGPVEPPVAVGRQRPDEGRPLTKGEVRLAKSIFGSSLDTGVIRLRFSDAPSPRNEFRVAEAFTDNSICFYGRDYASADFSRETNIFKYGNFMHELTHILQSQRKNTTREICMEDPYYTLSPRRAFGDYCSEQQAAMVEDYFRRMILHGTSQWNHRDTPQSDALLRNVVEDYFPEARKTRVKWAL